MGRASGQMRMLEHGLVCGLVLACTWAPVVPAQEPQVVVNLSDASFEPLVQAVADLTGQRFIVDPRVRASVTLEMDTPQGGAQLMETLQAVLRAHGFTTQQVGNDIKIVPERVTATAPNGEPGRVISAAPRLPALQKNRKQLLLRPPPPAAPDWFKEIRLQPVFSNDVQRGYRVYPGGTRAELARLGLDAGDLVTSINGRGLNDPLQGMQAFYAALAAEAVLVVRIERAGRGEYLQLANHYAGMGVSMTVLQPRKPQAGDPPLAAVLLQPVYENNKFRGFRVYPRTPGGIFGPQRLAVGDLVLAVNGEAFTSSDDADKLEELLESSTPVLLTLLRAGESLEVTVNAQTQR